MPEITDFFMRQALPHPQIHRPIIHKSVPNRNQPGVERSSESTGDWNFAHRADGLLSIVCPVADGCEASSIEIFNAGIDGAKNIPEKAAPR